MKFVISTQEFNYLINKVQTIIPFKPTSPILNNFLIEALNDELVLTATDLNVTVRCHAEIQIIEEGATTLPAKKLAQLIKELTVPNIEIKTAANQMTTIVAGSSRFKLHGMGMREFPEFPDLSHSQAFEIRQRDLKELLSRTSFAVSKEESRYALTGLLMHIAEGKISFVGTDGKKLARAHLNCDFPPDFSSQSIIPLKGIDEIAKNLLDDEGMAKISLMPDKIAVFANQTVVLTKLLTGDYPDVGRVIPERCPINIAIHREEMMSLLKQVSLFAIDHHHSAAFCFTTGEIKLSANTQEFGEGHVSMPVNYHGNEMEMAFNPAIFFDILRHCKEETFTFGLTDPFNPGVITDGEPQELNTASPLYVIMPMRLSKD